MSAANADDGRSASSTTSTGAAVRARIARQLLAARAVDDRLGRITLQPHQAAVVPLLRDRLRAHGGALLADAVGLGKTYVALAVAQASRVSLVIAPAALRAMWLESAERAGVAPPAFVSVEALSHGATPDQSPDLVIVDEAHHLRTTGTRRYAALQSIAATAQLLLLSATPVHNATRDLAALCALFLGDAAFRLPLGDLQQHVVRRSPSDVKADEHESVRLPRVRPPEPLALAPDDTLLHALAMIPSPVPPIDGGVAQALCAMSLVRAWCSSDAALRATARRRLATAHALSAALEAGEHPTRHQLRAWTFADDSLQLALPGIVLSLASGDETGTGGVATRSHLLEAVRGHAAALARVLCVLAGPSDADRVRGMHVRRLSVKHDGARMLAFSHSAHTVRAMFRELRDLPGVCALTGAGAEIASGRIARAEALERFATGSPRDAVTLLLATDLLSEGLNLQQASVVVHLDLPWTAARLEQRVGRVARPGALRDTVHVYAMSPPASGEALLRVDERLRWKLGVASAAVGAPTVGPLLLPSAGTERNAGSSSEVECRERVRAMLEAFRSDDRAALPDLPLQHRFPIAAAVAAPRAGWIACLHEPGTPPQLLVSTGAAPCTTACAVAEALALAGGTDCAADPALLADARAVVTHWWRSRAAARLAGAQHLVLGSAQRESLRRLDTLLGRTLRHERAALAGLAARARTALTAAPSARRDAQLVALGHTRDDVEWLHGVAALVAAPEPPFAPGGMTDPPIVALLLLVRHTPAARGDAIATAVAESGARLGAVEEPFPIA